MNLSHDGSFKSRRINSASSGDSRRTINLSVSSTFKVDTPCPDEATAPALPDASGPTSSPARSRKNDVAYDLPFAVGLPLPDGEISAAPDYRLPLFDHADFGVARFIGEVSVTDEFLRNDFRRT